MYLNKTENEDENKSGKEKENAENENTFENIFENIIEINLDNQIKRRNSFNGKNIFKKKILKKQNENSKMENNNQDKISSLLKKDNLYEIKNNKSINNKSKENLSLSNSFNLNKNENENKNITQNNMNKKNINEKSSLSSSSFNKRNFILKSELNKLNKEMSINQNKEDVFDCLLTQKIRRQEELNNNQFYKFFFDNNAQEKMNYQENKINKNNIISNTYLDEEENKEKEESYQLNEKDNSYNIKNALQNKNIIEETYSIKNLLNSNINLKNEIKKENISINNKNNNAFKKLNISNNSIKIENQIIDNKLKDNLYNQISNNQFKENTILENNNINQERNKNLSYNSQNREKNIYNIMQYNNQNNYINNFYNFQNPQKFEFKFPQGYYYYPLMQNSSKYNNKYKTDQFSYNNFYNNNQFFKSDKQFNNNKKMINNININNNINNNNDNNASFNEDQKLAKASLNLVKSQVGCRVLQEKAISDNKFANELLFPELSNNLKEICCDLFGNYLIQVLLEILTPENLDLFLSKINDTILDICLTEYGSRVIQKLINKIYDSPLLLNKLISSLRNKDIGPLFKSPYANHMLQKYLTVVKKPVLNNFIYDYIYNNFLEVVKSKHGVCVVQRGLSEGNDEQKQKILEITLNNLDIAIKDSYANFLIQYIIIKYERKDFNEILPFLNKIEENINDYCKFKFSASVIEKCFERGEQQVKEHIINNMLKYHSKNIIDIILNSFGIYVIKKALNVNNVNLKETIRHIINENIDRIRESSNAVKIVENLAQNSKEFANLINY